MFNVNSKRIQLFLLPFAGGNSTSFRKLEKRLSPSIEFHTIEYAGRGTRKGENFITDYNEFLEDVSDVINEQRNQDVNYALFGYSLGSAVMYDLLSQKKISGFPTHAFACARGSLFRYTESQEFRELSDEQFADRMKELGGIDERIYSNKRFLSIFLREVRADYIIWGEYKYVEGKIPCDTTIIYSPQDKLSAGVEDWKCIVNGNVDYFELGSTHFFINDHWQEVADIVNSCIGNK
ncbi:thioesterase domain-containing protein [Ruminococcus sp. OA3]|uniref:thioesterase II family protein n=1 Tax=Ruminococcus sp. OA3 TaxID=2914164 RepID=UPI001F063C19|nr:thioesterase domain-containing protein [Ruminococcus sp. OA3]MCH1982915.1 thioesterase domain-containing protein [Ruminococcus sp. OA3]